MIRQTTDIRRPMHPYAAPLPVSDQDEWVRRRDIPTRADDVLAESILFVMAMFGLWKISELIFILDAIGKANQ